MFTMAKLQELLLLVLATQIYVKAAPRDVERLDDIAKVETSELEVKPTQLDVSNIEDTASSQNQRQKRWYDFGGFGFPPPISPIYPNFVKRDESQNTGVYGLVDDPLLHVYRRIQDIASIARQPSYPSLQPPQFPIYLPVLYLPQACNCNPQTPTQTDNGNGTMPGVNNRFPENPDNTQDGGFTNDDDDGQDTGRPINFDAVLPDRPLMRPPPPVEHGSVQGDGGSNSINSNSGTASATTRIPPQDVPKTVAIPNELPTNCDASVLSCCHRPEITFECFTSQGCPEAASYGNPCEPKIVLKVIERFQKFYLQRTG